MSDERPIKSPPYRSQNRYQHPHQHHYQHQTTNPGVRKAVTLFGVTDLRQLIDRKHTDRDTNVQHPPPPPEDPQYNYLKDPARDQQQQNLSSPTRSSKQQQPPRKYQHHSKQIINSNRFNKNSNNKDGCDVAADGKIKKELRFEDECIGGGGDAGTGARIVSDHFPQHGNNKFHKTANDNQIANIKVEVSTDTGKRNCTIDENSKIPDVEQYPNTRKPSTYRGNGYQRGNFRGNRGGRGRGRGRGGYGTNYNGKRQNPNTKRENIEVEDGEASLIAPATVLVDNDWSINESAQSKEIVEENTYDKKPYNQKNRGSFGGWRGHYRNNKNQHHVHSDNDYNNRRQNNRRKPNVNEFEPETAEGETVPVDLDWSAAAAALKEETPPTESNNLTYDEVYEEVNGELDNDGYDDEEEEEDERNQIGDGDEEQDVEEYAEEDDQHGYELDKDQNDDNKNKDTSTSFDENLMMESITVVSSKYHQDDEEDGEGEGKVHRSVTINKTTKENEDDDKKV